MTQNVVALYYYVHVYIEWIYIKTLLKIAIFLVIPFKKKS